MEVQVFLRMQANSMLTLVVLGTFEVTKSARVFGGDRCAAQGCCLGKDKCPSPTVSVAAFIFLIHKNAQSQNVKTGKSWRHFSANAAVEATTLDVGKRAGAPVRGSTLTLRP